MHHFIVITMRQQLLFLLIGSVLCKNRVDCDVVSKTEATTEYFTTKDDLSSKSTRKSIKYVYTTDINKNNITETFTNIIKVSDEITIDSINNADNTKTEATTEYYTPKDDVGSTPIGKIMNYVYTNDINTNNINGTIASDIKVSDEISTDSIDNTFITSSSMANNIEENPTSSNSTILVINPRPTTEVSTTSTIISTFSSSTTQYPQGICSGPKLRYTDLKVFWKTDPNEDIICNITYISFKCTRLNYIDDREEYVILADKQFFELDKDSLSLQIGYQYNCIATFTDIKNMTVSNSTSLIVPPGSSKINVTANNLNVTWTAPFINQTLAYTISIKRLTPDHYVPNECENSDRNIFNYTTNNTYFILTNYLPGYNYSITVSSTFWGIHTFNSDDCFITTPTAAPGAPRNVSVEEYVNAKNEQDYTLHWKMPCNSNGKIQKYHVIISTANQSTIVKDEDIPNPYNKNEFKLNLTNLAKQSYFNYKIYAIGASNETGEIYFDSFMTEAYKIPTPVVTLIENGSTYFTIEWTMPIINPNVKATFHTRIYIKNLGPRYPRKENCEIFPDDQKDINNVGKSYNYTVARPFYSYFVTVTVSSLEPIASNSGNVTVATTSSVPDAPYNLTLNVNEHTLLSELSWDMPCNVNGLISEFKVVVSERYTEDDIENRSTHHIKPNEFRMNLQLKPSHIYKINTSIVLEDGLEGKPAVKHYISPIGFPGLPILNISNASNTSFVIEWLPPIEKTGPIEFYQLNITSLDPRYIVPKDCSTLDVDVLNKIIGGTHRNYTHFRALPYNRYRVQIRALTSRGYGNVSITEFNTTEGVPETVRNVTHIINNNLTEEYDATVSITFDPPCHTNGIIHNYIIEYHGRRKSYPDVHNQVIINAFDSKFTFKLQPEYNYIYDIWSRNELFESVVQGDFISPAGVPSFNANISIPIDSISTTNAKIVLKKEYFNLSNGDVRYIALLLREIMPPVNQNFSNWNSMYWPTIDEGVQQLTNCFWNPFETSNDVTFVIGNGSRCDHKCSCNMPLKDDTAYYLTIRVFTSNFSRDGTSIFFQTDKVSQLNVILGVIFGILFFAIVAIIGFYIWKKGLYRKLWYIQFKKPSDKPPVTSSTAIIPKKFIQYFKNAQSKPEFLKTQFINLVEKSKEIQAQKSFHFSGLLENKRKNRYVNILPYDDTRVKLLIDEDDEIGSDYINASYIKGHSGEIEYIATQGPLATTCRDFWKMVLQENVTIIVMVSQFIEKNKQKCYKYFPKNHESLIISDDMVIKCSTELHFGTYLVRNFQVQKDSQQTTVTHMQFLEWPDFNVPTGTEHMLQFIYQIRERFRIEGGVVIVHCSAGVGRTGTLIAADMLLQNINAGKQIDVFNTVLELRKQRVMMVQTVEQYVYLHSLVADYIDRPPTPDLNEASAPEYENMDMLENHTESQSNSKTKQEESEF